MKPPTDTLTRIEDAYTKYADMLYRIALSHTANAEDAEDAVHDVFMRYLREPPALTDENHEQAWFIRATINRAIDILRREKRRAGVPYEELAELPGDTAEIPTARDSAPLLDAVASLPPKYKSVMVLHYLEEKPVAVVAEVLHLSLSAVKMRLARGRELLTKSLRDGKDGEQYV